MTVITVNDDQKREPTLEEIGMFANRTHELFFRMKKGLLSPELVLDGIQQLSEGNAIVPESLIGPGGANSSGCLDKLDLPNFAVIEKPRMKTAECFEKVGVSCDIKFSTWLSEFIPAT